VGTRAPARVRRAVLGEGATWVWREDIGDQSYIAAYRPLYDVDGQGVGMLQTGFLQAPFTLAQYRALALLLLIFVALIGLSTWVVLRGAKSIFKPIEQMTAVVRATQDGREQRIGEIH
jgi:two-component system, NtrC family, sensor kinase